MLVYAAKRFTSAAVRSTPATPSPEGNKKAATATGERAGLTGISYRLGRTILTKEERGSISAQELHSTFQALRPSGSCAPERPSEAAFETTDFHFYLARRETFSNWLGSKLTTTRPFGPDIPDATPDVSERVDFSSLRSIQHEGISREDSCPNAAGIYCRPCSGSRDHLLVLRLHPAPPSGDSDSPCYLQH
jgi:hypothetical protein